MKLSYLHILALVAPVYLTILAGYAARRLGWLTAGADESLLRVVVQLLIPCLALDSILGNTALSRPANIILPPLIGAGTIVAGFGAAWLTGRWLRPVDLRLRRTFAFSVGIFNFGYLAIPLAAAFFDRSTLGVMFTHNLGVEIAFWTVGIMILTGSSLRGSWRRVLNPPVISILAGLALNWAGATQWIPSFATTTIHSLGLTAIPLALLLTGATVSDWMRSFRDNLRPDVMFLSCLLRLGALPLLGIWLSRYFPASPELQRVMVIQAAMPAGMLPVVIARHYGGDAGAALQVVIATSLLGVLTIPFWIRLGLQTNGL